MNYSVGFLYKMKKNYLKRFFQVQSALSILGILRDRMTIRLSLLGHSWQSY